tara:strand:- start:654 stop:848 length:195 start_codon:yes stop_codon:yes gene_type:complete
MSDEIQTIQLSSVPEIELDTLQYNNWITSSSEENIDVFETICKYLSKTKGAYRKQNQKTNVTEM